MFSAIGTVAMTSVAAGGQRHGCDHRGRPAHVGGHVVHGGGRLDRDAAGVERDALAHQRDPLR
jgi:hypothetical protein